MELDNITPEECTIKFNEIVPLTYTAEAKLLPPLEEEINSIVADIEATSIDNKTNDAYQHFGHLQKEFKIPLEKLSDSFKQYLYFMATHLHRQDRVALDTLGDLDGRLELRECWANFMGKYEYFPPHNHTGVYSFAIWNRIPYDLEEEEKRTNAKIPCAGAFYFLCPLNGVILPIHVHVNKSLENYICMFPSLLTHGVFPFYTSDDYRVSISGNIYVK